MRSPKPARAENPLGNTRRSAKAYLYLLPAFAVLAVFVVYPILMTLRMGFYQSYVYLTDTGTGFGLNSFRYVLQDPAFGLAVRNTMFIVLVGVPITIVLSLGAALLINSLLRTKGLFQTLYFLPYVTSTLAIGLVFPLALPLGIRLHQLFSGVFGAGATEVAVRSQPDHCGGDHFYHLERYGV